VELGNREFVQRPCIVLPDGREGAFSPGDRVQWLNTMQLERMADSVERRPDERSGRPYRG
jgi:hypothetical protein